MIEITYAIAISFVGMGAAYWMGRYSGQRDMEQIAGNLIEINGRLTNAGNRIIPLARPLTDAIRLAKYFTSPAGIVTLAPLPCDIIMFCEPLVPFSINQSFDTVFGPIVIVQALSSVPVYLR